MYLDSRGRLLKVMNILEEYCNDDKGVTMDEIISYLEHISDQKFDRKAIYRDIDTISTLTDIYVERKPGAKFYLVEKKIAITKEEVEIITNALSTARFISKERTKELINKLHDLTGLSRDKSIRRNIRIEDRIKVQNPDAVKNIEIIRKAIKNNRKIHFEYMKYNLSKNLFIEKQSCIVSPYEDVWFQDYYYMLGSYDDVKVSHYRVDRMRDVKITEEKRLNIGKIMGVGKDFNVDEYMSKLVGMSSGYEDIAVIKFRNELIGEVIDTLGEKVSILKEGEEHFLLRARVLINKKFVRWILGFGDGAHVAGPNSLKEEVTEIAQRQAEIYNDNSMFKEGK